jgi:anti-sigma regulatory factor (Ser/Thr protein kinase)
MPSTTTDSDYVMRLRTSASERRAEPARCGGFRHEAMLYAGDDELLAGALRFLGEGLARDEPAMVILSPRKSALLRDALGADAEHVRFADMRGIGTNPARVIPAWTRFLREAAGDGQAVRGISEPLYAGRSAAECVECDRHEALVNLAFASAIDFRLLCPYDVSALDAAVIAKARCTHPLVSDADGRVRRSASFHGLAVAAEPCRAPLPEPPADAQTTAVMPAGLLALRALVARRAQRAGLSPQRQEDLVLAVNELATNSIRHGGGAGTLTIWETADALVCQVTDAGRLADPLAGRVLPEPGQVGRYGLWLVNQLCDLVEQRALPDGNLVRVSMARG